MLISRNLYLLKNIVKIKYWTLNSNKLGKFYQKENFSSYLKVWELIIDII